MSDTLITIIAIGLAAILLFVFPLVTMADRADDVSQLAVQSSTTEFVDTIRTTGKITEANYDEFIQDITSTGNLYNVEMEVKVKDENLGKKVSQAEADKIGENIYYSEYTTQIEEEIEKNGEYICKQGDIVSVNVHNVSDTIGEQLQNFFYTLTGNDSYTISAQHAAIVSTNGK